MLLGIILVLAGLFMIWKVSALAGGLFVVGGAVAVGLQFIQEEPALEKRDYQSTAPTYTLRSSSPRK